MLTPRYGNNLTMQTLHESRNVCAAWNCVRRWRVCEASNWRGWGRGGGGWGWVREAPGVSAHLEGIYGIIPSIIAAVGP